MRFSHYLGPLSPVADLWVTAVILALIAVYCVVTRGFKSVIFYIALIAAVAATLFNLLPEDYARRETLYALTVCLALLAFAGFALTEYDRRTA